MAPQHTLRKDREFHGIPKVRRASELLEQRNMPKCIFAEQFQTFFLAPSKLLAWKELSLAKLPEVGLIT